jgi:hypothetical protein
VRECQHHFKGLNRAVKHYSTVQEMWKYMDLSRYLTKLLPFCSTIILMNINIINAPTILIEEGTKAVTLRSIMFLLTVKHIGFFSLFNNNVCNSKSDDRDSQIVY